VPIDRAAALRNAEKLLRQGKLDQAIAEYVRVVEDQPRDWNSANTLGDLYVRAGRIDKAVEQFIRIADHLHGEGFYPKAGAVYKKVLKIKPDQEHALLQSAEVAASQGLLVEARQAFSAVAESRRSRRDMRGVAQIRVRLGSLDPEDYPARVDGARARAELGDPAAALDELKELAAELADKERHAEAIEVISEAAQIAPNDEELRHRLLAIYLSAGEFDRARECAVTVEEFKELATALEERGFTDHALAALVEASRLDPGDTALKEHLARAFATKGDLESAAQFLTAETAGADPELRLMLAGIRLRSGQIDEGLAILKEMLAEDPSRREAVAVLGCSLAEHDPDAGYPAVDLAADAAVTAQDWASAAAALQEFVTRVPSHIPALMRLVEICVDGGLEATMYAAQAQLADAYIASGAAAEARFIAEDLVAREPWERANVERFRQALVLLGETDPDGVIAERLSGQSPFMSTDLSVDEIPVFEGSDEPAPGAEPANSFADVPQPVVSAQSTEPVRVQTPAPSRSAPETSAVEETDDEEQFVLSDGAIDLDVAIGDLQDASADVEQASDTRRPPPAANAAPELEEIDLSNALGGPSPSPVEAHGIDGVFVELWDEAASRVGDAEAQYQRGLALREAGELDAAVAALESASRSPRLRFQAATLIGRIYRSKGALPQAIEWFERAAEASAPTINESRLLLYELADVLEAGGEVARALAICLELQADAGDFKDVAARIDRLAKVQTRG
jgi:tetratricopeptide (TPR) repeat protein